MTLARAVHSGIILIQEDEMPKRFQNPRLQKRADVRRQYWFVRAKLTPTEKRKEHKLGFCDEVPRKTAMQRRADLLQGINGRRFVVRSDIRFSEVVKRFETEYMPGLGIAAHARYTSMIKTHLLPAFGKLKLSEIDSSAVAVLLQQKSELAWWTRTNLKGVLSAIFTAAKDMHLWEADPPTKGVRIGRKHLAREKKLLTVEQLRTLLAALPDHLKFMVLIMFGLGLRISETLGLKWADVDLDGGALAIRRRWYRGEMSEEGELKNETSCAVMRLGQSMLQEFTSRYPGMHRRGEHLFTGDDGKLPPDDRDLLRYEFRPILKRLGLYYAGFGFHAFRRQSISWRQSVGGASALEAQRAARHASLDMTLLYTLSDAERETAQQQKMFDELLGATEGVKH